METDRTGMSPDNGAGTDEKRGGRKKAGGGGGRVAVAKSTRGSLHQSTSERRYQAIEEARVYGDGKGVVAR